MYVSLNTTSTKYKQECKKKKKSHGQNKSEQEKPWERLDKSSHTNV